MQSLAAQQSFLEGLETDKAHPYIEDCIFRMAPIDEVLRLLCLQSFCNGGLRQRLLEYYKREVLQVYGFEHIFTLDNLDRIGLLYDSSTISSSEGAIPRVSPAPNSINKQNPISTRRTVTAVSSMFHRTLRRSLRLVVPPPSSALDLSDSDQQLAQIYSGYIPLSVRLVQAMAGGCLHRIPGEINSPASTSTPIPTALALGKRLVSKLNGNTGTNTILGQFPALGIQNLQSTNMAGLPLPSSQDGGNFILSLVPGVHFEQTQVFSENGDDNKTKDLLKKRSRIQVVVVVFIGGVTHAEISSLRRLATIYDMEIIVITTGIINARTFIRSLSQDMSPVALTVM
ncbi:Vacuolar protein sorting-associated protein 33A [Fasciola gigantica]|uniref:Vacuolar protein sorting-associated protein 33A n=1 Tax=Fasciola gigantica TaxID=46835 RepID=A0A504YZQ0_FASGI|nr:Vacuolar protein sorting-associated protein 33A [Fasciola gigantica]